MTPHPQLQGSAPGRIPSITVWPAQLPDLLQDFDQLFFGQWSEGKPNAVCILSQSPPDVWWRSEAKARPMPSFTGLRIPFLHIRGVPGPARSQVCLYSEVVGSKAVGSNLLFGDFFVEQVVERRGAEDQAEARCRS